MLSGFTTTGLEIWEGRECSRAYFRQRVRCTSRMLQQFMMNHRCWLEHIMLNRNSGLDPSGVKLRPAAGLEAADYVIGGYWVSGKIIENLADIGYDTNSMFMASFDWRLAPFLLENIKGDREVAIIAHSYASQVWLYFMKWVESDQVGKQGNRWIDQHIEEVYEHITRHGSNGLIVRFGADSGTSNITANELLELLGSVDENLRYLHSQAKISEVAANASDPKYDHPKYWSNPLAESLPYAPNMKLFCLYGIRKPLERAYLYKRAPRTIDGSIQTTCDSESASEECSRIVPHILDTEYQFIALALISDVANFRRS
ncbi:unnamed protein product [Albugo candida]|uniref:Uncharacterized protein n=1 Tax=Albugo candida TaxID=65357 RepID=A0A024GNQ9_9STRA|nr:unnamed protein product [Albugo candida]|eukprot:CCI48371.1 unnamed protein product [Albugo candida]